LLLQNIVQAEQGSNFISKLHTGKLDIIPWPVIESRRFYSLYSTLKRRLDSQQVSHPSAGEFLYTLKILMAKLKVIAAFLRLLKVNKILLRRTTGVPCPVSPLEFNIDISDFFSESLTAHRAQTLLTILPVALQYGLAEADPENEPLKVSIAPGVICI
jgi:hypothetical protein